MTADTEQTSYSSTQDPKEPCLSLQDIAGALGAEALFVSPVQPSDNAANALIRAAVTEAIAKLGSHGCAAMVGYEFGEHPETAVARMRWAAATVSAAFAGDAGRK